MAEENQNEGKWEHPYISFEEAMSMADKIKEMGKPSVNQFADALKFKNAGFFRLRVASLRRWGLCEGRGELSITQAYKDISSEKRPGHALEVKRELFLNIPLFQNVFTKYKDSGLPQEPYLTNAIKDSYNLSGRNPNLVANIVRGFISEYFPRFGEENYLATEGKHEKTEKHKGKQSDQGAQPSSAPSLLKGNFPILIVTKDDKFQWDVKSEVDWNVVDSVINSIKERWKGNKDEKS